MQTLVDLLKSNWRLGSPLLILTMVGIGVALLYARRLAPWGRRWLVAFALAYWFVSTPLGSDLLSAPITRRYEPIQTRERAKDVQTVIILGGGIHTYRADGLAVDDLVASAFRIIEGARLYGLLGRPLMIVSGGNTGRLESPRPEAAAFRDQLVQLSRQHVSLSRIDRGPLANRRSS